MHLLLLMNFLGTHGHYSWSQRVRHSLHSRSLPKDCKTLAAATSKMKNSAPFYEKLGIFHNFSAPRTPQQNRVVERKNMSLEELARTMLSESSLSKYFWADVVSTSCYMMNRVLIRPILTKTAYELFNGRKPNHSHLKVFGCRCFILNNEKESLGKFNEKADNGIFIGYSSTSHAYRVYNKRLMSVEESVHVVFDEINHTDQGSTKNYAEEDEQNIIMQKLESCPEKQLIDSTKQPVEIMQQEELPKEWKIPRDLSVENIIGRYKRVFLHIVLSLTTASIWLLSPKLNLS